MTRRSWLPKAIIGPLAVAAGITYGLDGGGPGVQVARHVMGALLQLLAPLVAGLGCLTAARAYARGDRERAVWMTGAWATLAWAAGRAVFTGHEWIAGKALPFPSLADGFFVAFYLLLGTALCLEARLVWPVVERPVRRNLAVYGGLAWALALSMVLVSVAQSQASVLEKALAAFYPAAAVLLVPAGLLPAAGFRGGTSAYPWLAVAMAAVCLAAASFGFTSLIRHGLHPAVHRADALWVAGFVFLAVGGFWQRAALEEA
ncbi:MAG: hypothetical protein FJX73_01310 [Armatimonadetes bacterium]|nr:hypothetical protein [Armatimonadota bacterium]